MNLNFMLNMDMLTFCFITQCESALPPIFRLVFFSLCKIVFVQKMFPSGPFEIRPAVVGVSVTLTFDRTKPIEIYDLKVTACVPPGRCYTSVHKQP